jgi:hypothetical protein
MARKPFRPYDDDSRVLSWKGGMKISYRKE